MYIPRLNLFGVSCHSEQAIYFSWDVFVGDFFLILTGTFHFYRIEVCLEFCLITIFFFLCFFYHIINSMCSKTRILFLF
jgi:hypothetical protein